MSTTFHQAHDVKIVQFVTLFHVILKFMSQKYTNKNIIISIYIITSLCCYFCTRLHSCNSLSFFVWVGSSFVFLFFCSCYFLLQFFIKLLTSELEGALSEVNIFFLFSFSCSRPWISSWKPVECHEKCITHWKIVFLKISEVIENCLLRLT